MTPPTARRPWQVGAGIALLALSLCATSGVTYILAVDESPLELMIIASALFGVWGLAWHDRGHILSFIYLCSLGTLLLSLFRGALHIPIVQWIAVGYAVITIAGGLSIRLIRPPAQRRA